MEQHDMLKLFGNVFQVSWSKAENISLDDKEQIKKILGELWLLNEAMEVDRFKVQKLVKEKKLSLEQLGDAAVKTTSRTLRASPKKDK
jgi:hypothetical protein